jgi:hypothetical protein
VSLFFRSGAALFSPCTVGELLDAYDDDGNFDETPYIPGVDDLLPWGVRTSDGRSVIGQYVLERNIDPHASVEPTRGRPIFTMNKVPVRPPIVIYMFVVAAIVIYLCSVIVWCCSVVMHRSFSYAVALDFIFILSSYLAIGRWLQGD